MKCFLFKYKSSNKDFILGIVEIKDFNLKFVPYKVDFNLLEGVDVDLVKKLLNGIEEDINSLDKDDIYEYIKYFVNDFYFEYCEKFDLDMEGLYD